jgi:hypothetical protein
MKFELYCKFGVRKTYEIDVEESDPLQAVYSKESCPHKMQVTAHTLSMCLSNFPVSLEEITLVLSKDFVRVKSYVDNQKNESLLKKLLLTELTLSPGDFENYDFNADHDIELTFCLKEMKAILHFCEKQTQPISFYMDGEGKPILMSVSIVNTFEADFVLATLLDPEHSSTQSQSYTSTDTKSIKSSTNQTTSVTPSSNNLTAPSTTPSVDISQVLSDSSSPGSRAPKRKAPNLPSPQQMKHAKLESNGMVEDNDGEDVILWGKDIQSMHRNEGESQ